MKTKNDMSLKALINKKAKEINAAPQLVMQNYIMECLLDRISRSQFKDNFILKGGFLLSSVLGLENRSTMDMDTTVTGFPLTKEELPKIIQFICSTEVDDDFTFTFDRTEDIREIDDYPGLRVFLFADYGKIHAPFSIDVTTGDKITPSEIDYSYKRLFDKDCIQIKSYPLETVMAEKLETILSRNIANIRPRDFYDVYALRPFLLLHPTNTLKLAIENTSKKRNTAHFFSNYKEILTEIENDKTMQLRWKSFAKTRPYATGLIFETVCNSVRDLLIRSEYLEIN